MAESTAENISASDIESLVDALPEFLAETKCPSCNSSDASMYHPIEDLKTVKYCSSCDTLFGIDDSMNLNDLRQLMEEGNVRFKTANACACGNDDVDAFLFEKCEQSGKLYLKCINCKLTKDIEVIPSDADAMREDTQDRVLYCERPVGNSDLSSACHTVDDQIPPQSYQPFTCECGNEKEELFEKVFDASGKSLVSVRCLNCDWKTKLWTNRENYCLIECVKCGSNTEELFDKTIDNNGKIVGIFCKKCETYLQLTESMEKNQHSSELYDPPLFVSYNKTRVTSLRTLKRGDHVAWKRCGGIYSHHGIVIEVLSEKELDVIHNTVAKEKKAAKGGAKCKILRGNEKVDLSKGDLYLCNYKAGECLEPDEVIARALSLLGEKIYNLFLSNCEHFATLCKTSRCFSSQVKSLIDGIKAPCICGPAIITLAVEGIVFGVKTYRAFKEYKEGVINWKEFCGMTAEAGCSSVIRFLCTSTGGAIGQLLIPVPFVGSLIGCTIGAILGHFIGGKVGKLCGEAVRRKSHAKKDEKRHPEPKTLFSYCEETGSSRGGADALGLAFEWRF